tara:strand:+ start:305848 stop:307404 length:1557 start_codon:yes stop_codon:yes gene_type:complete
MSQKLQFTLDFEEDVNEYLAKKYPEYSSFRIISQSLDARNANRGKRPKYHYVIEAIKNGETFNELESLKNFSKHEAFPRKPVIVGAGPAGLFCALRLIEYGIPSIILERGERAHKRMIHISKFWRYGEFDSDNNVCYGEGGAGLFSDGKLITRIKSPFVQYVMDKLVEFGAPKETAYMSNPHLGSNKIRKLIGEITEYLRTRGCEIYYNCRVDEIIVDSSKTKVQGVVCSDGKKFDSDHLILATGHSAKEMYFHLQDLNVEMKSKDFAVGVRVEHPRRAIDFIQHGPFSEGHELGSARYRLSWENPETKKGTYSFCMCPGGYVLSSGTDSEGIVVNGMSNYARNSPWSNSALVVSVESGKDFSTKDLMSGLRFQHDIEKKAYELSVEKASGKEVPAQGLKDFLDDKSSENLKAKTSCPSGIFGTDLNQVLPSFITDHLRSALKDFDRKMNGFISNEALFLAPETRTSAPLTILRDKETLESPSIKGLYPCGEGAGYAGGITSAAVDGIKVAESLIKFR